MSNRALVLIDFQNEWIDPNSEYFVGDISEQIENTNKLIEWARKKNFKIIFTKHVEKGGGTEFAENSYNAEIIKYLEKMPSDTVIIKNKISPFFHTDLDKELTGILKVFVAGILTNLCVRSFIHDAYDRDIQIGVAIDCCIAFDQQTQDFTIKDIKETRPEVEFFQIQNLL